MTHKLTSSLLLLSALVAPATANPTCDIGPGGTGYDIQATARGWEAHLAAGEEFVEVVVVGRVVGGRGSPGRVHMHRQACQATYTMYLVPALARGKLTRVSSPSGAQARVRQDWRPRCTAADHRTWSGSVVPKVIPKDTRTHTLSLTHTQSHTVSQSHTRCTHAQWCPVAGSRIASRTALRLPRQETLPRGLALGLSIALCARRWGHNYVRATRTSHPKLATVKCSRPPRPMLPCRRDGTSEPCAP